MAINLAKTHAKIFGRTSLQPSDNRLIKRVLLDTCPSRRLHIIQFLLNHSEPINITDCLAQFPGIPFTTMRRLLEDLHLLELVTVEKIFSDRFVVLNERFRQMLLDGRVNSLSYRITDNS
jgi:hypothetical protein